MDVWVVCRQLGYGYARAPHREHVPKGTGPIWFDDVRCTGREQNLISCFHGGWGIHNCQHNQDAGVACSTKGSLALQFNGDDISQRGISVASSQILESITVCFWTSAPEEYVQNHRATLLSYATAKRRKSSYANTFLLVLRPNLDFYINDYRFKSGVVIADGKFHHVCVTWDSVSGNVQIYKNGNLSKIMVNIKTGEQIKGGGIWVIGQDQDSLGGSFQTKDSFKGILTEVNIWDKVLGSTQIKSYAKDCNLLTKGNYKAYSNFDISRATNLVKPPSCHFAAIP